jgi:hypothetical protein
MSTEDSGSNGTQGRVTKAVGSITDPDLENKSTTDQVKAGMKTAKKNLEDAGYKVKDAVTP